MFERKIVDHMVVEVNASESNRYLLTTGEQWQPMGSPTAIISPQGDAYLFQAFVKYEESPPESPAPAHSGLSS